MAGAGEPALAAPSTLSPALLTAEQTRAAEKAAIANGLSGAAMMEAAGEAVAAFIIRMIDKRPVAVLCGPGNNGGDGYVVARKLKAAGFAARVLAMAPKESLAGDARLMADLYDGETAPFAPLSLGGAGLIVDAIFGTGLTRPVDGEAKALIMAANAHPAPVIAVDIPSGVDADTGAIVGGPSGAAIAAAATVTFIARKPGHILFPGRALAGETHVAAIGVKPEWLAGIAPTHFENHLALFGPALRRPGYLTHKYDRGAVAVISGPRLQTGAARLAARAALRAGAGVVTMLSSREASNENAAHLTAIMVREVEDAASITAFLSDPRITASLVGPGAGVNAATREKTLAVLGAKASAVLDADALSVFSSARGSLFAGLSDVDILTPHQGEFAKLFPEFAGLPRIEAARAAAALSGAVVVLKGPDTIIARKDGRVAVNTNAPFDLATAGSGDVLAGFIAGFRAQGAPAFEAAMAGVWFHGAAGQMAGPGLIADDLPEMMPQIFRRLYQPQQTAAAPQSPAHHQAGDEA